MIRAYCNGDGDVSCIEEIHVQDVCIAQSLSVQKISFTSSMEFTTAFAVRCQTSKIDRVVAICCNTVCTIRHADSLNRATNRKRIIYDMQEL